MANQRLAIPSRFYIQSLVGIDPVTSIPLPIPLPPVGTPVTAQHPWTPASQNVLQLVGNTHWPDNLKATEDRADVQYIISQQMTSNDVDDGTNANAFSILSLNVRVAEQAQDTTHWTTDVVRERATVPSASLPRAVDVIRKRTNEIHSATVQNCERIVRNLCANLLVHNNGLNVQLRDTILNNIKQHGPGGQAALVEFFLYYITAQGSDTECLMMKTCFGSGSRTGFLTQTLDVDRIYRDYIDNIVHTSNRTGFDAVPFLVDFLRWKAANMLGLCARHRVLAPSKQDALIRSEFSQLIALGSFPAIRHLSKEELPVTQRTVNWQTRR